MDTGMMLMLFQVVRVKRGSVIARALYYVSLAVATITTAFYVDVAFKVKL